MMGNLEITISFVNRSCRLRCAGHIMNLVVKAMLYWEGLTEFRKKIVGCSDDASF